MWNYWRAAALFVVLTLLLTACADPSATATTLDPPSSVPSTSDPSPAPIAATAAPPQPTAVPALPKDVLVAGVDVGGLQPEAARKKLDEALAPLLRPLDIQAADANVVLQPDEIDLQLPLDALVAQALAARPGDRIPLQVRYDASKVRGALEKLAGQVAQPSSIEVISATDVLSRSFATAGGARLDVDAALGQIDDRLQSLGGPRRITLTLSSAESAATRPSPAQLQEQIEAMAREWNGVVGIYVYDLASGQVLAQLNQDTVFSGASVMKVPILLQAYVTLPQFDTALEQALQKMIVDSDNLSANKVLAASVGGSGTEDALDGALGMSDMLRELGLEHTYLNMPYEAKEYLVDVRKISIKRGPKQEGTPPYTQPDPVLRTTPAEMSQVFRMIDECSRGTGLLLEKFAEHLSASRCQEMLDRLNQNGDRSRIVAGLPDGTRVEHKSGWIEDMQADVGIVRSPGGNFITAIYLYKEIIPNKTYLADEVATPVIASFARLIYSYYNPIAR